MSVLFSRTPSLANIARGIRRVAQRMLAIIAVSLLPFLALLLGSGLTRFFAAASVIVALMVHAWCARKARVSWLYGFTHPIGAFILCYILLHATILTLWRGGIVWRDTFYSLKELRKGLV